MSEQGQYSPGTNTADLPYPEPDGESHTSGWSGSETSRERAKSEDASGVTADRQARTMHFAMTRHAEGITVKELREAYGWHHGQASSALSNLHKAGRLARLTETRGKCKVYVYPDSVHGRETEPHGGNRRDPRALSTDEKEAMESIHWRLIERDWGPCTLDPSHVRLMWRALNRMAR